MVIVPKVELPIVLSPTRAESGISCHRKHLIADMLERGKGKAASLAFGTTIHAGVGELHSLIEFKGLSRVEAFGPAMDRMAAEYAEQGVESEKMTWEMAERMLTAYVAQFQRVGPFDAIGEWKPLSVEDRVKLRVGDFVLSFQQDRAYQSVLSDAIRFGDLKTASRPDRKWEEGWKTSLQMKLYALGTKRTYGIDDVEGFIEGIDKNVKPKLHYVMLPHWSDEVLEEAEREFLAIARADEALLMSCILEDGSVDMAELEYAILVKSRHNRANCFSYGSACEFLDLCNAEPSERRGLLHAEYEIVEQDY